MGVRSNLQNTVQLHLNIIRFHLPKMFHLALLTLNVVSSADTDTDCCVQKKVGDILYNFEEIGDGKEHGCFDNCIYSRQGDPDTRFCFKKDILLRHARKRMMAAMLQ